MFDAKKLEALFQDLTRSGYFYAGPVIGPTDAPDAIFAVTSHGLTQNTVGKLVDYVRASLWNGLEQQALRISLPSVSVNSSNDVTFKFGVKEFSAPTTRFEAP